MSFTKAARVLRLSQSAVSLQVKTLEQKLELQLFLRHGKSRLALTPAGQRLANRCRRIFNELEVALGEIAPEEIKGTLIVSTAVTFGSLVVVPFLNTLETTYPNLDVELKITDTLCNFDQDRTDLAIRWGSIDDPKLTYERLAREHFALVASPDYLKQNPPLAVPKDLQQHTVIARRESHSDWKPWLDSLSKTQRPLFEKTRIIDNTFGMVQAAKSGMGVALLSLYAISDLLKTKKLTQALSRFKCPPTPFSACYPKTPYAQPKISAFVASLKNFLKTHYDPKTFDVERSKSPTRT